MTFEGDASTNRQHRFFPTEASDAAFVVTVVNGPNAGASIVVDDAAPSPLLVGKSPVCALRIDDPAVSRRHLSVEVKEAELHVVDLGSKNRTSVNGVAVEAAFLRGGESIVVGETTLRVDRRTSTEPPNVTTVGRFGKIVGASREMRRLYGLCAEVAASRAPALLEGEPGTGKETLAESLHEAGPRAAGPFVVFDGSAVPTELAGAYLFGNGGAFQEATGGTLVIDEIAELALSVQEELARAIDARADVRVLVTTERDLDRAATEGIVAEVLVGRFGARIALPPLRVRRGDVGVLARHFWRELGGDPARLTAATLRRWEAHSWPGNVAELRNAVARAVTLGADEAPRGAGDFLENVLALDLPLARARTMVLESFERQYLARVLAQHGGNVTRAAAASGIARRQFYRVRARTKG